MNKLVSILMPIKNDSQFIEETLETIVNQTYQNWELIVVDDHSSDRSLSLLKSWSLEDNRIHVYINNKNGIIPALQLALANSRGELITRMDSDDLMHERRLELMHKAINNSSSKTIVTGLVRYFSEEPISDGYLKYESWLNEINLNNIQWPNIYRECVIASPNWMMQASELKAMNGFDDLVYPEDYHLSLLWYQNDFQVHCLPEVTLLWREHPDRTSRTSQNYDQKHFFDLKIKAFLSFEWNNETIIIWGKNDKQKLVSRILTKNNIPFEVLELHQYQEIENYQDSQLLVAVYPEMDQREALQQYLEKIYRKQGEDWWYL